MNASKLDLGKIVVMASLALVVLVGAGASLLKWRGFRASSRPSTFETAAARSFRNFATPAQNGARVILSLPSRLPSNRAERIISHAVRLAMESMRMG